MGCFRLQPVVGLVYFSLLIFLVYVDRGVTAALVTRFESAAGFSLSSSEAGTLGSIFILGFMLASFAFGYFVQSYHPFTLISTGMLLWCGAVLLCACAQSYWMLLLGRAGSGAAEAGLCCLVTPYLLEVAPGRAKTVLVKSALDEYLRKCLAAGRGLRLRLWRSGGFLNGQLEVALCYRGGSDGSAGRLAAVG